jgi:hypothetical protein
MQCKECKQQQKEQIRLDDGRSTEAYQAYLEQEYHTIIKAVGSILLGIAQRNDHSDTTNRLGSLGRASILSQLRPKS